MPSFAQSLAANFPDRLSLLMKEVILCSCGKIL
jgi:hypothetical protein